MRKAWSGKQSNRETGVRTNKHIDGNRRADSQTVRQKMSFVYLFVAPTSSETIAPLSSGSPRAAQPHHLQRRLSVCAIRWQSLAKCAGSHKGFTKGFTNAMTHALRIPSWRRHVSHNIRSPRSHTTFEGASPSASFAGRAWRKSLGEHGLHGRRCGIYIQLLYTLRAKN